MSQKKLCAALPTLLRGYAVKKSKLIAGEDGVTKKRYVRRPYFVCDLDPVGNKKLKQSRLSCTQMTGGRAQMTLPRMGRGTYHLYQQSGAEFELCA